MPPFETLSLDAPSRRPEIVRAAPGLPEPDPHRDRRSAVAVVVIGALATAGILLAVGLLLTHVLAHGPVGHWDETSTRWLSTHRDGGLNAITNVLSRSADTFGILAGAVVVLVVLWRRRRWDQMAVLVTGLVLELSIFLTVNAVVGRARPAVERLGSTPSTGSFPSGHTAATLVLYAAVALFVSDTARAFLWRALAWLAAALLPLAVGFARVYRGFHHPTDVLSGYLLGAAVLFVAVAAVGRGAAAREELR